MKRVYLFVIVAFLYFYFFPLHHGIKNPNEYVRVYMTRSIVDFHSMIIGKRVKIKGTKDKFKDVGYVHEDWGYVNDRALVCFDQSKKPPKCEGYLYSAKAPGTSFIGVPFYFLLKMFTKKVTPEKAIFFLRFFTTLIPTIIFLFLFFVFTKNYTHEETFSALATFFLGFGTMVLTYSNMFAGHIHAAIFLFSGFALLIFGINREKTELYLFWAGFFVGFSVISEYPSFIGAFAIFVYLLSRRIEFSKKKKAILYFILGGVFPALLGAYFHYKAFGSPFKTPYSFLENPSFIHDISPGIMGITYPSLNKFAGSMFSPFTGLFFFNPFFILLFYSWFLLLRYRLYKSHPELTLSGIIPLLYILFISSHSLWRGGWTVGPRYIVMSVPFFAYFIFVTFYRSWKQLSVFIKIVFTGLLFVSVFNRILSFLNSQGYPFEFYNSLYEFSFYLAKRGFVFQNILNFFHIKGLPSALPFLLITGFTLLFLIKKGLPQRNGKLFYFNVFLFFVSIVLFQASFSKPLNEKRSKSLTFFMKQWTPKDQGNPVREFERLKVKKNKTEKEKIYYTNLKTYLLK